MTPDDYSVEALKARDRADLERTFEKFEHEQRAMDASVCRGCGRRWWIHPLRGRAVLPTWIPEAGAAYHTACWNKTQEPR